MLPNAWLGVSVESQRWARIRLPLLVETPVVVRLASCEPLLGALHIRLWLADSLDWVIVGGESGPKAPPIHPGWATSLRDQCQEAGVAFFFERGGRPKSATPLIAIALWPSTDRVPSALSSQPRWSGSARRLRADCWTDGCGTSFRPGAPKALAWWRYCWWRGLPRCSGSCRPRFRRRPHRRCGATTLTANSRPCHVGHERELRLSDEHSLKS
ncbi:DUF5131 family protein [Streptomyces sp. 205]|uniref:DUF5131 family protein n=1 Tax=Streptomyces coffeae TaxID=621382 RepID=A0ABS1NN87_9ACTN|nr:DUF5131 family protein [Streptomyces coffeae]